MLVLSRKIEESVVVGGADGLMRLLKVTVLGINKGVVRLCFEADDDVSVHCSEVWDRIAAQNRGGTDREIPQGAVAEVLPPQLRRHDNGSASNEQRLLQNQEKTTAQKVRIKESDNDHADVLKWEEEGGRMSEYDEEPAMSSVPIGISVRFDAPPAPAQPIEERVDGPLKAHDATSVLDQPAMTEAYIPHPGTVPDPAVEQPGMIIGSYKLLKKLGEGGMGTVWIAEQSQPVKRRVALKLIKAGMDSSQVLQRFESERQALALMDHQNIAKVLEAGATPQGRPYFAMELIKGIPITKYCDQGHLTMRQRLELFIPVCQAVQHAHQKGVIHRDLKPSNVLIALYDGKPVPKIIDFGVAKATSQTVERMLYTEIGQLVGTLEYMAPEQAQLNNFDVDTRSDIYSLGVLLYELLTGTTPFEKHRFKEAAGDEIRRIIREEEPPPPSTRLISRVTLPALAAGRHTEPARLTKLVRGELDWIVMKSLEKDRSRRYETANGFAMDIQRYLAGEPVLAAPPSASYRLWKFASKHRVALTTRAAFALLLVAGVAGTTWQAVRATRAETAARLAEQELRQAQQAAADRAEGERLAKLDAQSQKASADKAAFEQAQKR